MAVSYKKLWKLLIDHDMKKKDLAKAADISNYTWNPVTVCKRNCPFCVKTGWPTYRWAFCESISPVVP